VKKPKLNVIRDAVPLSASARHGRDPDFACDVCHAPAEQLEVWREHDEHDRPIPGTDALVYLGEGHPLCRIKLDDHPRLYAEVRGEPGSFPRLCGPCEHRDGLLCRHPDLKVNGGGGLMVHLNNGIFAHVHICGAHGRIRPLHSAIRCAGRRLRGL